MALRERHHLLSLFFLLLSSVSCYICLQEDPPYKYIHENSRYAYPTYYSIMESRNFKDLIELRTDILSLKMFNKVGSTSILVKTVNVDDFGAKGDGSTDDTEAFEKAWEEACSSNGAVLVVPKAKSYRLKPIRFSGPCKSDLTVQIYGTIEASDDRSDYEEDSRQWLMFDGVENLLVKGGGTINGNGKVWWQNSCKINKNLPCKNAPTALTFYNCTNVITKNLKIQDAQQIHVSFENCINVQALNLHVLAPEESPNTDGIHVTNTQNIQITSCAIGTGDDCISIVSGSQKVKAMNITCGPGHGISIGSLGSGNSKAYVSGVTVENVWFYGTTNGVRIKTWQGGSGSANNIVFKNVEMENVTNPIIIDQNYCDQDTPCKEQSSAVQVKNVVYKNIKGTSASDVAIKFDCSDTYPCQGIVLQNIDLKLGDGTAKAECNNVKLTETGNVSPHCP
ncbi:Glyco_hydro_28 domain-containing protein [Cephalotus follicularis]|uniref:endo-polygalacturonase n=1 Tax=Cephalotus follicularis TaxID=3775 RepID=A0A1Q3ANG2_CEPFO|nr:Glyco_hydro_28 domain-containing protein [Cephalotus follicularis]